MGSQRLSWDEHYSRPHPLWKGPVTGTLPKVSGRVLELGCGNGKTAGALVATAEMVVGADFSRPGLVSCQRSLMSPRLHLVEGDVRRLPFADHSFDHVVAFHVLGHLLKDERGDAMAEIRRVLVPGGYLAFRSFSHRDMRAGVGEEVEAGTYVRGNGIPTHYFSREDINDLTRGLIELSLQEIAQKKRYHGSDHIRAVWDGRYQTIRPMR